jgi:diguanylate cyclase (GGDEF)-like protein
MLDLDGFKSVNDAHGHAVGDLTLVAFAERISKILRAGAVLSRMGGDEFALIMPVIASLDEPTHLARRILAACAEPFMVDAIAVELGAGIGIAIAPDDGTNAEQLVRNADRALYRAKGEGRSSVRFFEPLMDSHVDRRIQMERELRAGIVANLVVPHYRPLVALDGNRIIGFEALARWESAQLGPIPPDIFIPIAEETGLIGLLGDQLLRQASLAANAWPRDFVLAFNISPTQLRDPTLGLRILSIVAQTGFSARRLEIEITENALVENGGVAQSVIADLRQAGVRIVLDGFGTGPATFGQLLSFDLDKIKIDRSFVAGLDRAGDGVAIVRAILGLADGFGLTTSADGIEDAEQLACLKANGCQEGQGSLFGKAVPANEIAALLRLASPISAVA